MKPRALGNTQKGLRDEALMLASNNLRIVKDALTGTRPDEAKLLKALGEIAINEFEVIQALKRMDVIEAG